MRTDFDIRKFDEYKEDNRREVKQAAGGLPGTLWDTYSAFANGYGGVILLGVVERPDGSWKTTGLKKEDARKLEKSFWDTVNNPNKVSVNVLTEKNVEVYEIGDDVVFAIRVPAAERKDKPVYLNKDPFGHTFRRDCEGDYHCDKAQVRSMLRDQEEDSMDMKILEKIPMDYLNMETVHGYRNRHKSLKSGHPFERLADAEYLRSIGAAAIADADGAYHPTGAGLLMFGDEYNIVREFPEYFLDYREMLDPAIRWTDRVQSSSGEWSGNVCDFYFRVYNKIIKEVKVPFKLAGGTRVDDTPVHKALREALANCLINADFYGTGGVVVKLEGHKLTLENPGCIRVGKKQIRLGGKSDPRNKGLMKMFNLIDIGERAGSGVPDIYNVWADEGFAAPEIVEGFNPERTTLVLPFGKMTQRAEKMRDKRMSDNDANDEKTKYKKNTTNARDKKLSDKKPVTKISDNDINCKKLSIKKTVTKTRGKKISDKKIATKASDNDITGKKSIGKSREKKTQEHAERIVRYLRATGKARAADIAVALGLSQARARGILAAMREVEPLGGNRNRTYRLKPAPGL